MSKLLITTKKNLFGITKNPYTWGVAAILFLFLMPECGFCALDKATLTDLETSVKSVQQLIFSKPVRILVLTFSVASGAIISFLGGKGLAPVLSGLSLGIFLYFIPKILGLIETVCSTFVSF